MTQFLVGLIVGIVVGKIVTLDRIKSIFDKDPTLPA